ncbi:hypothetical protein E6C76_05295 [Pseudothauera nasutitermitis]|uniref:Uncharacterized protein n=1 Tax=Pseudothauera nasutitermitis TaxID=2565930 RepID=A0A4S4B134_9RHOO|nr:hypothetical protein [Pseudothauera nasutitermitis]THF66261.1 hypothetical protein E6C76_05295 [Pseudothauera nasutitermitis]
MSRRRIMPKTNPFRALGINELADVLGHGAFVLSTDAIFAIDNARLRNPVGSLGMKDRMKNNGLADPAP